MIACNWHGRVPTSKADAYYRYLLRTCLADYRATPGNRDVYVFCRTEGPITHFVLTTFWEPFDAIRAFAGADYERVALLSRGRRMSLGARAVCNACFSFCRRSSSLGKSSSVWKRSGVSKHQNDG